jgi:UDP-N-acetylmuramoylalanine--D-glutamate ligase
MSNYTRLIIGLGKTGWSVARYLMRQGLHFRAMDTRAHPPQVEDFKRYFPEVPLYTGGVNQRWIWESQEIILSPGVDPCHLPLHTIHPRAVVYSDIDLFNRIANAPIIGVTGTDGKSTVTVLIQHLLTTAGQDIQVGGNLGTPALDLLVDPPPDFYLLELSSFQLSITKQLKTAVSIFLNFATDHLERHQQLKHYHSAKQTIYRDCQVAIWNRNEPATYPKYTVSKIIDFGIDNPSSENGFGLSTIDREMWLTQGKVPFIKTGSLKLKGTHNYLNALAALAAAQAVNCPVLPILQALPHFRGLPHRLEWIYNQEGITWINDSKATNSHATQAALSSFTPQDQGKVILIAGGIYKRGDNPSALKPLLLKYVKQLILIGQDASILQAYFIGIIPIDIASTLLEAVKKASSYAVSGDIILLSPACASQDMFKDYAERGDCFKKAVKLLLNLDHTL